MIRCGNCGFESADGSSFCAKCGAPLDKPYSMAPPVQSGAPQRAPTSATPWGWIVGGITGCGCLAILILAAVLYPVFRAARIAAVRTVRLSEARQIDLAALIYAGDHHDKFPSFQSARTVTEAISPYLHGSRTIDQIPNCRWDTALSGVDSTRVTDGAQTWLMYLAMPNQADGYALGFADGHVRRVSADMLKQITGKPPKLSQSGQP